MSFWRPSKYKKLEERVKAIENYLNNQKAREKNEQARPPVVEFAEDTGEVWIKKD